jgi:hypothetical protein
MFLTVTTAPTLAPENPESADVAPLLTPFHCLHGGVGDGCGNAFLSLVFPLLLISFLLFIHEDQEKTEARGHGSRFAPEKPGFGRPWRAFSEAFLRVQ